MGVWRGFRTETTGHVDPVGTKRALKLCLSEASKARKARAQPTLARREDGRRNGVADEIPSQSQSSGGRRADRCGECAPMPRRLGKRPHHGSVSSHHLSHPTHVFSRTQNGQHQQMAQHGGLSASPIHNTRLGQSLLRAHTGRPFCPLPSRSGRRGSLDLQARALACLPICAPVPDTCAACLNPA